MSKLITRPKVMHTDDEWYDFHESEEYVARRNLLNFLRKLKVLSQNTWWIASW